VVGSDEVYALANTFGTLANRFTALRTFPEQSDARAKLVDQMNALLLRLRAAMRTDIPS
jgi:hypothetical protein